MTAIPDSPRSRLIDTAIEVFAIKGFEAAPVRDICRQAGVNIAAVNYYFGDKERLYIEAVKSAHARMLDQVPMPATLLDLPAVDQLRAFIAVTVARVVRQTNPFASQLVLRELAHPTAACAEMVRHNIRPMCDVLMAILRQLLPEASEKDLFLTGFSIVGQCLFYKQSRAVARLLMGEADFERLTAEEIADHVFLFTFRGLEARGWRPAGVAP